MTYLDEEESRHCIKVLRRKPGDAITITNGKGVFFNAAITVASPRQCEFQITGQREVPPEPFSIHIALAPTRNTDRTDWFVEKSVEVGVNEISFIQCDHSERTSVKIQRLDKIAASAMKQSVKAWLPRVNPLVSFKDFLSRASADEKFIAVVDPGNPIGLLSAATRSKSYLVLIGPEGDFSPREVEEALGQGYRKVSLGESRLRTETAGVVACHTLQLVNRAV